MLNQKITPHWLDYTRSADLSKANKKCSKCYGTGLIGRVFAQGRTTFKNGVDLICRCVPRPVDSVESEKKPE